MQQCSHPSIFLFAAFDTSCFSGEYVTGEKIGDEYFQKLYSLRNEAAKVEKNSTNSLASAASSSTLIGQRSAQQSNDGCEPVSNDKSSAYAPGAGVDGLSNNVAAR